jgi:hypothetical protein
MRIGQAISHQFAANATAILMVAGYFAWSPTQLTFQPVEMRFATIRPACGGAPQATRGWGSMERRKEEARRRTLKGAKIIFNNRQSTIACVARNLTETGARLEFPNTLGVPDSFTLVSDDGAIRHECTVKWRKENALGVEFAG